MGIVWHSWWWTGKRPKVSPREKLLLETKKHNVLATYSTDEAVQMFRRFPLVDHVAIDGAFGEAGCQQFAREIKALNPEMRVVICTPNVGAHHQWADATADSPDPANLLKLLEDMGRARTSNSSYSLPLASAANHARYSSLPLSIVSSTHSGSS